MKENTNDYRKTRRSKKKVKKRDWSKLRFICLNDGKFDTIEFPSILGQSYIDTFGLLTVRTKEEIINWLNHNNVY
jgi:hypothetical protein